MTWAVLRGDRVDGRFFICNCAQPSHLPYQFPSHPTTPTKRSHIAITIHHFSNTLSAPTTRPQQLSTPRLRHTINMITTFRFITTIITIITVMRSKLIRCVCFTLNNNVKCSEREGSMTRGWQGPSIRYRPPYDNEARASVMTVWERTLVVHSTLIDSAKRGSLDKGRRYPCWVVIRICLITYGASGTCMGV